MLFHISQAPRSATYQNTTATSKLGHVGNRLKDLADLPMVPWIWPFVTSSGQTAHGCVTCTILSGHQGHSRLTSTGCRACREPQEPNRLITVRTQCARPRREPGGQHARSKPSSGIPRAGRLSERDPDRNRGHRPATGPLPPPGTVTPRRKRSEPLHKRSTRREIFG